MNGVFGPRNRAKVDTKVDVNNPYKQTISIKTKTFDANDKVATKKANAMFQGNVRSIGMNFERQILRSEYWKKRLLHEQMNFGVNIQAKRKQVDELHLNLRSKSQWECNLGVNLAKAAKFSSKINYKSLNFDIFGHHLKTNFIKIPSTNFSIKAKIDLTSPAYPYLQKYCKDTDSDSSSSSGSKKKEKNPKIPHLMYKGFGVFLAEISLQYQLKNLVVTGKLKNITGKLLIKPDLSNLSFSISKTFSSHLDKHVKVNGKLGYKSDRLSTSFKLCYGNKWMLEMTYSEKIFNKLKAMDLPKCGLLMHINV
ncbi:unnamed protein product [Moneuplotes crassus]|uniref:Uncharacterized protein n=1 Tax=Euplotes crassus TaxID=5936 RepID=A0AAD1XDS2_EUPCR|nr:unnamed protein product [Moneuplotes crassus]